jgi:hypothetical protein
MAVTAFPGVKDGEALASHQPNMLEDTQKGKALGLGDDEDGEGAADPLLKSALGKLTRRVVPLCVAIALMNHLDRSK